MLRVCLFFLSDGGTRTDRTRTDTQYIHTHIQHKPQFLVAVPRLFETIYRGVQQKFATEKGVKKGLISFFTKVLCLFSFHCGWRLHVCASSVRWQNG